MALSNEKKLYLKGILNNSLAQALIRLVAPQESILTIRIILFLSLIISNGLAFYYIAGSVMSFLDYEVITTSRTIYEMPTQFPKITICNRNRFQTKYAFVVCLFLSRIITKFTGQYKSFNINFCLFYKANEFKPKMLYNLIVCNQIKIHF